MRWDQTLQLVDVHCEGETGRIVTGGLPPIPGETIDERFHYVQTKGNELRRRIILEPRGPAAGSTNLIFPPDDSRNHAGFIVLQPDQAHAMSGSNAICVTTALLETGYVPMVDGENIVRLETAAGLVKAKAHCVNGKCQHVTLSMPASFVEHEAFVIKGTEFGDVKADIAFGGVFYAIMDCEQLGLTIEPASARKLSEAGMMLKEAVNSQVEVQHPEHANITGVAYVMFRSQDKDGSVRTATTMWPGRLDRSPCGTGNSANLAIRASSGEVSAGDEYVSRSTIGSEFRVKHAGETRVGNKKAVLPEITGRAWIFGMHQIGFDPDDPFKDGFAVTDTWGPDAGKI